MYTSSYGLAAARLLKSLAVGRGDPSAAIGYASARDDWGSDTKSAIVRRIKSGVSGLATSDIGGGDEIGADLMLGYRPLSVFGRLPLHLVPKLIPMLTQTGPARAYFAAQGKARKMTAGLFSRDPGLSLKQVAAMTVATNEMMQDRSLNAETALLADLLAACGEALDIAFLDRTNTGSAATPASVTSGATPIPSTGSTLAELDANLAMAIRQLSDAGSNLRNAYWIMPSYFAGRLALTRGIDGAPAYPGVGALGGQIAGLPLLTSAAAQAEVNSDDLSDIVLLDASEISYSEDPPSLRVSSEAMIEMDDAPAGSSVGSPTGASAHLVSMFQEECTALMAQLSVNWKVRRAGMVQVISNVPAVLES